MKAEPGIPSVLLRLPTLIVGLCALGAVPAASAATSVWSGSAGDGMWSTGGNWNPAAPAAGDEVVFPGSGGSVFVDLDTMVSPGTIRFTAAGPDEYTLHGAGGIEGTDLTIRKEGSGLVMLALANTFTGGVQVDAGRLMLGHNFALGAAGNTVKVAAGAGIDLAGFGASAESVAANRRYLTLEIAGAGTLTAGGANRTTETVTGIITRVREGIYLANSVNAFGDKLIIDADGTGQTGVFAGSLAIPIEIADGGRFIHGGGALSLAGPITTAGTVTFSAQNTGTLTITSSLDVPGDLKIPRLAGSGNLTFTQDNIVKGSIVLEGRITASLGNGGTSGAFRDGEGNHSPVDLGTAGTLALNRSDTAVISYDALLTGTGTFQKQGSSTVRRSVEAAFSNPSGIAGLVYGGTLLLNNTSGHGLGAGTVQVTSSATLGGTGSVEGAVTISTATALTQLSAIAPGDGEGAIGDFSIGGLVVPAANGRAQVRLEVDGARADKLVVTGDINLNAAAATTELAVLPLPGGVTADSYTLIEYGGALTGKFNSRTGVPTGYRVRQDTVNKKVVLEKSTFPFEQWSEQIGDQDLRGRQDDPDGDGWINGAEFALDGNPSDEAAPAKIKSGIAPVGGEEALVITFPVRAGAGAFTSGPNGLSSAPVEGVVYRVQASTDLNSWNLPLEEITAAPGLPLPEAALSSDQWEYRSFRVAGAAATRAKAFIRVLVD